MKILHNIITQFRTFKPMTFLLLFLLWFHDIYELVVFNSDLKNDIIIFEQRYF